MAKTQRSDSDKAAILKEARERFKRAESWEATARGRFKEDLRLDAADAYNQYQWPTDVLTARSSQPCLTINKIRQHNLDVLNDARQSKISIKVRALKDGASYESAQIYDGVIRHIEYISNADSAYQHALAMAVRGGIGYIRITTDYMGDDSFDQEIFIRRVKDPLTVYLDPDITEFDGSDARFGFVFTDMPKDEFDKAYPKLKDVAQNTELGQSESWCTTDHVRIAEYFRCVKSEAKLIAFTGPDGQQQVAKSTDLDKAMMDSVIDAPDTMIRNIELTEVEHFTIIGDTLAEEKEWPGRYIPLLRCVGEETVIDGQMDRKGHTRALIDPQRMFNYNAALDLNTPIPTPTGWVRMGDVRPGDMLFDENGKPAEVLGLSPIFINRDCYRVEFDDGSSIVTDGEHKWTVEEINRKVATDLPGRWTVKDVRTDELTPKTHFIWATKPLDMPEAELPVDPYVLGYWLGNGASRSSKMSCHADDGAEIKAHVEAVGYATSGLREYANGSRCVDFAVYGLAPALRTAGVLGNKHIPDAYLRASQGQREALLQGLMDSDGSISPTRQCAFTNTNQAIVAGFEELLRTLGIKAVSCEIAERMAKFPGGNVCACLPSTRFSFSAPPEAPIFRLSRKRDIQSQDRPFHLRRTRRYRIRSVTPVPSVPVRCLGVDTPNHLFLAGPGMVPTHNSASIEYGALQSKIPYTAAVESIEGYEATWEAANTNNSAILPYKAYNDAGQQLPEPKRQQPPMGAPVFMQGMNDAAEWMRMASGQYQADMGAPSNERSGVAIQQRQRQGDNATYHYLDHQASMIRFAGKQLLDLIPKVYDTERMIRTRDEAGNEAEVHIDPNAPDPMQTQKTGPDEEKVVFNPKAGSYDVIADVGAAYATRRQEAFAAYTQILSQNKELTGLIGDIALRFADFPGAEEGAQRLKRMVPKQALEDGPSPDVQALQQQIQQMQMVVDQLNDKLASKYADHVTDQEQNAIKGYDSITKRITALKEQLATDPQDLLMLVREVLTSAIQTEQALEPALDTTAAVEPTGPAQNAALSQGEPAPMQGLPAPGFDPSVINAPGAPEPVEQATPEGVDA